MNKIIVRFQDGESFTDGQIREVLNYIENQKTTDKDINTNIVIDGDDGKIEVVVDEFGDFLVKNTTEVRCAR